MTATVPVIALTDFYRRPDGRTLVKYTEGEVYAFPLVNATHYARIGRVRILEVVEDKPKPKRKRKSKKKETPDV